MLDSFCPLPFLQVGVSNAGNVEVCCHSTNSLSNLNLGIHSIDSIWNSKDYQIIREQMLNGEWPDICFNCKKLEEKGMQSPRYHHVKKWSNSSLQQSNLIDTKNILSLHIQVGNICNLKCRSCSPEKSSQIAKEWEALGLMPSAEQYNFNINDWLSKETTYKNIEKLILNLETLKIEGSEPSITPIVFNILDTLIVLEKAPTIVLNIVTNLTNVNNSFKTKLEKFNKVDLQASLDGYKKINDYIRYPSKWDILIKNLNTYLNMPNVKITINHTVQLYNIMSLPYFILWYKLTSYKKNLSLQLIPLETPSHLNIEYLPLELKKQILNKLFKLNNVKVDGLHNIIKKLQTSHELEFQNSNWSKFISYTKTLDKTRNQDVLEIVPEFSQYFND